MNNERKIKEEPYGDNNSLVIPSRQVSFIISGISAILCCAFVIGYFIGKKEISDYELTQNVRAIPKATFDIIETKTNSIDKQKENYRNDECDKMSVIDASKKQYCANLISFATKKHANQFVKKLAKQGIEVYTKERKSSSKNGSLSLWYQVVTGPHSDKHELEKLVSFLTKQEKLQGVTIVTYT